ncbi:MAG TPA: orotidine-5'-phosphate decarboxylase [Thermoanaerobaculia bacterium]|nr:orotidine-5'-phosphate decarboxylase [Thermoanaerobaculia bacterium]
MTFEDLEAPGSSDPVHLSSKSIPPEDRLIFALDVPSVEEAKRLVLTLREAVQFYKVGLELFATGGYFELIDWLVAQGKKVFADLKLFDVPETVRSAVRQLAQRPITLTTVHGNDGILEAACREKGKLKILAVTVLTSLDQGDLTDLGFEVDVHRLVLSRARRALEIGCDGIISSGLEAKAIRDHLGDKLLIVTPGIRPVENRPADDQKRVVTVDQALRSGADYVVIGRPIRNAPDPYQAARQIQETIAGLFVPA